MEITIDINSQYRALIRSALMGERYPTRMGVDCLTHLSPAPIRTLDFPIISIRKQFWKSIVMETIWLLRGDSSLEFLQKHGVKFWDPWAYSDNTLGKAYAHQFRNFGGVDQFEEVLREVENKSQSRRLMVNIWNGAELNDMAIPPCCFNHQVRVINDKVHMTVFQRSCDLVVGLPQNMATYGLLHRMYAKVAGLNPGLYTHHISDAHIYDNQIDDAKRLCSTGFSSPNKPWIEIHPDLNSAENLLDFLDRCKFYSTEHIMSYFKIYDYNPLPYWKVAVNV
jgi:thymidylate synthase